MKNVCIRHGVLFGGVLIMVALLSSCVTERRSAAGAPDTLTPSRECFVPHRVAILSVIAPSVENESSGVSKKGREDFSFVAGLIRSTLYNQMVGKGYEPLLLSAVDRKMSEGQRIFDQATAGRLSRELGAEGIVVVSVSDWSMLDIGALENISLSAEVAVFNAEGRMVGMWEKGADRKSLSVPTSAVGVVGVLLGKLFSDSPRKKFRQVVYDWSWKVAQEIPASVVGRSLPQVVHIDTNVDQEVFGLGQRVAVKVVAEPELSAWFSITGVDEEIPLRMIGEGEYEGTYLVREGTFIKDAELNIRLVRGTGIERKWTEPGALITLDGVVPPGPSDVVFLPQKDGVHINWQLPKDRDLAGFIVERNNTPTGRFQVVKHLQSCEYLDSDIMQGARYYYRVRSLDRAGNTSEVYIPREVVVPVFDAKILDPAMQGRMAPGNYRVEGDVRVPAGQTLEIVPGTSIAFAEDGRFIVAGQLVAFGERESPIILSGANWAGMHIEPSGMGRLQHVIMAGSTSAVEAEGALIAAHVKAVGQGGVGFSLNGLASGNLDALTLSGWDQAVAFAGSQILLRNADITENQVGVYLRQGGAELVHNSIHSNQVNIRTSTQLVLAENYLGPLADVEGHLEGPVLIRSVLDAPFPHGNTVAFMADEDLSQENLQKRFQDNFQKGVQAFKKKEYGRAFRFLQDALRYGNEAEAYLYLAYTQLELGEPEKMEKTMEKAIAAHPYDYRIHQLYARHLLSMGQTARAEELVERAFRLDAGNPSLLALREFVNVGVGLSEGSDVVQ